MKTMQGLTSRRRRPIGHTKRSFRLSAVSATYLFVAVVGLFAIGISGCFQQKLPPFMLGTSCSAENVQRYANEHNMTYEQALDQLRKEEAKKWEEVESKKQQAANSGQ